MSASYLCMRTAVWPPFQIDEMSYLEAARRHRQQVAGTVTSPRGSEPACQIRGDDKAATPTVSFLAQSRTHTAGHYRSSDRSGNRRANDRSQSTAATRRRPLKHLRSPKQSPDILRRRSRSDAGRTPAVSSAELALPTHCCPWPISRRTTGLLWSLTFDHPAEKASDVNSGRSRKVYPGPANDPG